MCLFSHSPPSFIIIILFLIIVTTVNMITRNAIIRENTHTHTHN